MSATSEHRPLALVTGASSDIGIHLYRQFAQNGFDLIIAARGKDLLGVQHELVDLGAQVYAVQVDLAT